MMGTSAYEDESKPPRSDVQAEFYVFWTSSVLLQNAQVLRGWLLQKIKAVGTSSDDQHRFFFDLQTLFIFT
jgi:hypothetical protein